MHKYITTHTVSYTIGEETLYTHGAIIANHYNRSLKAYQALAEEATKAFPDLTAFDIQCLVISKSGWCKSCPIIRFPIPNGSTAEGWKHVEQLPDIRYT